MLGLGGGLVAFAALSYFAAEHEHLTGWKWGLASIAVTLTIHRLSPSFIFVLPAQFGLFLLMWRAHARNKGQGQQDVDQRQKEDHRLRREHVRQVQQEAAAKTNFGARDRERAASDDAALKERQERVRLAREAREREEKERGSVN